MADFDPFSGGHDFYKDSEEKTKKPSNIKTTELIKKTITTVIILGIVAIVVYFLFFNTRDISFDVTDREGRKISTQIEIRETKGTKSLRISSNESIKLNKSKKYTYSVNASGYSAIKAVPIDFDNPEIKIVLMKNIALAINSITCPAQVFLGQNAKCELQLQNNSPSQDYNLDNLTFEADVKDWPDIKHKTFVYVDSFREELTNDRKIILAGRNTSVFVTFDVPTDKKYLGNKKIRARVIYTDVNKDTNFNILETPTINFTSDISSRSKMISGETISKKYTIDNTKNKTDISDLELSIVADYQPNDSNITFNFNSDKVFELDYIFITVNKSSTKTGLITIKLPNNIRAGKIEGKLSLNSSMFPKAKDINFSITVEEPPNLFEINLSKSSENLTYDSNTNSTNTKTVDVVFNNKNKVVVNINDVSVKNSTGTTDCNNWVVVPTLYNNYPLQPNEIQSAPIILKGNNLSATTATTPRFCAIKVEYVHPFTQETITILKSLTINVG